MAPSHASDSSEGGEEGTKAVKAGGSPPAAMASSLAGLPLRQSGTKEEQTSQEETKDADKSKQAQSGQLKEFLDLATSNNAGQADIAARLEAKRVEHERQRELQKKAFEEQMKQLELQQEREERELMQRASNGGEASAETNETSNSSAAVGAPVRSRSGNDLASFNNGTTDEDKKAAQYANAKSMPGSRRHSGETKPVGEGKPGDAAAGNRKTGDGQQMLNSFLFDDELDTDLQNSAWGGKYLQMDDDKFPTMVSRGDRGKLPPPRGVSAIGAAGSGRSSPVLNKKDGGLDSLGKVNGFGSVDAITDQFSNFNIDTHAFGNDSASGPFGGYVHDHGAFFNDDASGQFGSMGANRFAGLRLEDLQGDMLPLCKDQFGCRYLQKKLEDGNAEHRDMIFNEIFPHFGELMIDPFANYLSQRLLEFATDEQRDALIDSISGELVTISLNMHGTRAVQKMIDYLSTQRQVQSLILALNLNVVTLIKDLNGNHVIQKCLNHLPPEDNQFIYNAVATHCIEVATHRHGCCVLQRCIDHASESQRIQLVTEITYNSLTLVQDAFGNYVVQYVLDLNDNRFIEAIVRQFLGNVSALSAQKFSSNVVEKCIRVADATGRRAIIDELLNKQRLERLLRDSFANYVVQTALDYAEPAQRAQLIETIRPILPMIRNTPYGKRIQSKIQRETGDGFGRGGHGGPHGGYHHHHMVPGGGHFYAMPGMHGGPMGPGGYMGNQYPMGPPMGHEYGRGSPYLGGNGYNHHPQGPPLHQQQAQTPNPHQQNGLQQHAGAPPPQFGQFPGMEQFQAYGGQGMNSHAQQAQQQQNPQGFM